MVVTDKKSDNTPFKVLGKHLNRARELAKESVAEVSGAVEIDEATLERIEEGRERPSEDILLLLITHFGIQDDEAVSLWELAGYDRTQHLKNDDDPTNSRSLVMIMALDSRIVYSDKIEVVANTNGVILNFLQSPNGPYQAQTVARVGMSREQSQNVLRVLQQTLSQSAKAMMPKSLPAPGPKNKPKTERS